MKILPYIYLSYMFISLYFLSFYFLLYLKNRKSIHDIPKLKKHFSVSVLIPAYNEEEVIKETIEAVFKTDYSKLIEVIVIDDGSKDKTAEIVKELIQKYPKLKLLKKKNSGKADSLNRGIKIAKGELIAVIDCDSFPEKDSIRKLVGFFEDDNVGSATCSILVRNKKSFFEKLQSMEYSVIALTRKLLEGVGAIYVTPGPLALYRKKAIVSVGGFDAKNITEDIELTWNLAANNWGRKMCLDAKVTTIVPDKFGQWFRQRQRWSMGGIQTIIKYKNHFLKKGIVGYFILPFFILSTFLGLLGLSIFVYLIATRMLKQYFFMKFSFLADTALITLEEFYFTPTILNYLGLVLFLMGAVFTILILALMKEEDIFKKRSFFKILVYLIFYLTLYPFIMISGIIKLIKRDMTW